MAPHPKEHPLAHRFVVPNGYLLIGETVRVIDWLDRCGEGLSEMVLARARVFVRVGNLRFRGGYGGDAPIPLAEAVAVLSTRGDRGMLVLHHSELPSYDPVPCGVIS